ncbi:MAG: hypothetical protein A2857_06485 [Candidatus Levybacteria bacterium RIFCSPHIGHO2_01_FULL_36_15]|nr:MAG: hypothetical protein A2857_06485 [Candidatus Levybacteria bacterium RIFCSPHIGHO2_01_FULL_36_15]
MPKSLSKLKNRSKNRGFTMLELLTTLALIGIMAGVVMLSIDPVTQQQKGWDAKRKSDLGQVQRALEMYYQDYNRYPASGTFTFGSAWNPYISMVPPDPHAKTYIYWVDATNFQSYALYANMERGKWDSQACAGGLACPNATARGVGNSCGGACNYGVSSSNIIP